MCKHCLKSTVCTFIFLIIFCFCLLRLSAQTVPPGLGKTNLSSWIAVGVKQDLDSIKDKGWSSSTYAGIGRVSNQNSHNPFKYPGVFIINQEFYNRFHYRWEYSLALSYRKQDVYLKDVPYSHADPPYKNELRLYSRFSYLWKTNFMDITPTVRQEVSKYYTPEWSDFSEDWRLRTRFRLKFDIPLNNKENKRFILYSEQLFSTSRNQTSGSWSQFKYADSRFSFYFSMSPQNIPVTFNFGYMLNWINATPNYTGHYFAIDVILKNPFSVPANKQKR